MWCVPEAQGGMGSPAQDTGRERWGVPWKAKQERGPETLAPGHMPHYRSWEAVHGFEPGSNEAGVAELIGPFPTVWDVETKKQE